MSTSLLYHAFGVRGYYHVNTKYKECSVFYHRTRYDIIAMCPL